MPPGDDDDVIDFVPEDGSGDAIDFVPEPPPAAPVPMGTRATGNRRLVLDETTIEGSPTGRGPRQTTVAPGTGYTEIEVEEKPQKLMPRRPQRTPQPSLLDRLRERARSGAAAIEGVAGAAAPIVPGYAPLAVAGRATGLDDVDAALRGAADSAYFGFADEVRAGRRAGGLATTRSELASPSFGGLAMGRALLSRLVDADPEYETALREERAADRVAREGHPAAYGAGQIVGSAPLMMAPGGQATALGRIATAGGLGAASGALRGAGESQAEDAIAAYDQPSLARDALEGAALEGALSAAGAGAGEAVAPVAQRIGRWVSGAGERLVEPAARLRNSAAGARYASETDRIDDPVRFAETLRESDISTGLRSTGAAGERAAAVRRESNRVITDLANQAGEAEAAARASASYRGGEEVPGTVTTDRLAAALGRIRDDIDGQGAPAAGARAQLDALLERYREAHPDGVIPLSDLMGDWRAAGNPANFRDGQPWNVLAQSGRGLRREFRSMMEEAMESASGPEARAQLAQALERVHAGRTVERGARRVADRQGGNRLLSLTDYLAAGSGATAGALTGDPVTGIATAAGAAAVNRAVRGREHAVGAMALEALAPRLRTLGARGAQWAQTLEAAQRRGSTSLAAAHAILQRQDPAYRRAIEEMDEAAQSGEETSE